MTLFDSIQIFFALFLALFFGEYGSSFGWFGTILGWALGLTIGYFVGSIPFVITAMVVRFKLKRTTNENLKKQLWEQYFISHLIIAELVARGEPVEQFRNYAESLFYSTDEDRKKYGVGLAKMWFPDL